MPIKTIIELQAKPGQRDQLLSIMNEVTTTIKRCRVSLGWIFTKSSKTPMGWSRSPDGSPPRRARPGSSRVWILGRFNLLMQSLDAPFKATNLQPIP